MIDDFRGLAIFVAVAEAGSFSEAGRRLKLSTSVVSHHIGKLEQKLALSFFFRSTRALSLTPEGESMLPAAKKMVAAAEEALHSVSDRGDELYGALKITMPAFGDQSPVQEAVWAFARAHRHLSISLHSSDEPVDLVKEGYDLAIRLGELKSSALKSRRVADFPRQLVASPLYLAERPPIETLADLQQCDFVRVSLLPDAVALERDGEEAMAVPHKFRLEVTSIAAAKTAVMAGLGIQRLPESEVMEELRVGALVRVLPEWSLPARGVYAVWPESGPKKKLTRRLLDFIVERIAQRRSES